MGFFSLGRSNRWLFEKPCKNQAVFSKDQLINPFFGLPSYIPSWYWANVDVGTLKYIPLRKWRFFVVFNALRSRYLVEIMPSNGWKAREMTWDVNIFISQRRHSYLQESLRHLGWVLARNFALERLKKEVLVLQWSELVFKCKPPCKLTAAFLAPKFTPIFSQGFRRLNRHGSCFFLGGGMFGTTEDHHSLLSWGVVSPRDNTAKHLAAHKLDAHSGTYLNVCTWCCWRKKSSTSWDG